VGHGRSQRLQVIEQVDVKAEALAHGAGLDDPGQVGHLGAVAHHRPGHAEATGRDGEIPVAQKFVNDDLQGLVLLAGEGALLDGVAGDCRRAFLHVKERQYCLGAADVACK